MDSYAVGQVLYRAYVSEYQGVFTVKYEIKSIHEGYVKMVSDWNGGKFIPGQEYRYTEAIETIIDHYAPTPIEALEKLRAQKQGEQSEQLGVIAATERDILAITKEMLDDHPETDHTPDL